MGTAQREKSQLLHQIEGLRSFDGADAAFSVIEVHEAVDGDAATFHGEYSRISSD